VEQKRKIASILYSPHVCSYVTIFAKSWTIPAVILTFDQMENVKTEIVANFVKGDTILLFLPAACDFKIYKPQRFLDF